MCQLQLQQTTFLNIYFNFSLKISEILCETSVHMKCQNLFSVKKNNKNTHTQNNNRECPRLQIVLGTKNKIKKKIEELP